MGRRKHYYAKDVEIEAIGEESATMRFGRKASRGTAYQYEVKDLNVPRYRNWSFTVFVPKDGSQAVVRPLIVPAKRLFSGLERRAVVFMKATKHPHRGLLYCKVNLSDVTGEKNRVSTLRGERNGLPQWFDYFRMRLKDTVTTTRANDGGTQVILVDKGDLERMIRAYMAMRVWVLEEDVHLPR